MTELAVPSAARQALERAQTLPEIKMVIDGSAVGLEALRRLRRPTEEQVEWAEVKLDAERAAGAYLLGIERHPGGRPKETSTPDVGDTQLKSVMKEAGIEPAKGGLPSLAKNWQLLARLPEDLYEKAKAEARDQNKPIRQGAVLRLAREHLGRQDQPRAPKRNSQRWRNAVLNGVAAVNGNAQWLSELEELPGTITDEERTQILKDMKAARTMISRFITAREMEMMTNDCRDNGRVTMRG